MLHGVNLGKRFGARLVLRAMNFQIAPGTAAAVVGANGAGKSTLLKIVAGLTLPSAGRVFWQEDGRELAARDLSWMCGLSAPDAPLTRELSVLENLEFIASLRGLPAGRDDLMAQLEKWDLSTRSSDMAGDLSSGLRTRLQLAAALLHEPRILLLDEPSANLDGKGRELLQRALVQQRERGIVLVATNDPTEAAWCDVRLEIAEVTPRKRPAAVAA